MKKEIIFISSLIILLLFGSTAFALNEDEKAVFTEDFETARDIGFITDENSKAQIMSVFGTDGSATRALKLNGSSAIFDAVKDFDITDSVIEFDFLPQNITEDGFVVFSVLSGDNLAQIPVLSISEENLCFMGENITQSLHIDWYKIKLIVGQDTVCVFVNNRQKGEVVPLFEGFDMTKALLRFGVSGINGKNSIYIDNINIFHPIQNEAEIEACDFFRYECAVDEIASGEVEGSISVFNYNKKNTAKNLQVFVGLFDKKGMCRASASQIVTVNGGESTTITQVIKVPEDVKNYKIKVFCWDENMTPYRNINVLE